MIRHPEYKYCIKHIEATSSEILLYISDNGSGWKKDLFDWTSDEQFDGPDELLKRIQDNEKWTIKSVGILQYGFEEDFNNLVFQTDDLLGFVIIINDTDKYDKAMKFIKKYI